MAKRVYVSMNCPIDDAMVEQKEYEKQGYVVVESYGNDFDVGNILEYAGDKDRTEVLKRHDKHMLLCEMQRSYINNM